MTKKQAFNESVANNRGNSKLLLSFSAIAMCIFLSLSMSQGVLASYTIDGNTVTINKGGVGQLNVTPHTAIAFSTYEQIITARSDLASQNMKIAARFNEPLVQMPEAFYKTDVVHVVPNYEDVRYTYQCNGSYFNYTTNPNYAWCWDNPGNGTVLLFEHSFDDGHIPSSTIWWDENEITGYVDNIYPDWLDVSNRFVKTSYNGLDYYVTEFYWNQGDTKSLKIRYEPETNAGGKWDVILWRSSESISEALASGNYILLDPWFNDSQTRFPVTNIDDLLNPFYVNDSFGLDIGGGIQHVLCHNTMTHIYNDSSGNIICVNDTTNLQVPSIIAEGNGSKYGNMDAELTLYVDLDNPNDNSDYNLTGYNVGAISVNESGVVGSCQKYSGTEDYTWFGDYSMHDGKSALTAAGWLKLESNNNCFVVGKFDRGSGSGGAGWLIYYENSANRWSSRMVVGDTTYTEASGIAYDTNWHHIAMTYDGEDMRLFVDGVLTGNDNTMSGNIDTIIYNLTIGAGYDSRPAPSFDYYDCDDGFIDEVFVRNETMSDLYIEYLYNNTKPDNYSDVGAMETTPPPSSNLNILFTNSSFTPFKTLFDEGENFFTWWNWTDDETSNPLNDTVGMCNYTVFNGIIEQESTDRDFTLCDTGSCGIQNPYSYEYNLETNSTEETVTEDVLVFDICHTNQVVNNLNYEVWCNGIQQDTGSINSLEFGDCASGTFKIFEPVSGCEAWSNVTVILDNNANSLVQSHTIEQWEYDRRIEAHLNTQEEGHLYFNSTENLWIGNHSHESYLHGQIQVDVNCTHNTEDGYDNSGSQNLTIVNIPPVIAISEVNNSGGVFNLFEGVVLLNYTGVWQWLISFIDDDPDTHNITWFNGTGDVIASLQDTNFTNIHETSSGLFDNLANPYNITAWANDTAGDTTTSSLTFNVSAVPVVPEPINMTPNVSWVDSDLPIMIKFCDGNRLNVIRQRQMCDSNGCEIRNQTDISFCAYGCEENITTLGADCIPTAWDVNMWGWTMVLVFFAFIFGYGFIINKIRGVKRR